MANFTEPPPIKLSICIATFNRGTFIGYTLESIIAQATSDCEIIVSDNASTDNTEQVVSEYAQRFSRLRYIRQETNQGLDRNFDSAIRHSQGEYCWIKSDDDLARPGAIARILEALRSEFSLVILNMEVRDLSMSKIIRHRWINFNSDRMYEPSELDRLFVDLDYTLLNIGNIVIKRSLWLSRDRETYYGSLLIHLGVIFQQALPERTLVIAEPLINYRAGNIQSFSSAWSEILLSNWPSVIDRSAISESARDQVRCARGLWGLGWMLYLRRSGYSLAQYRCWIRPRLSSAHERLLPLFVALLPRSLAGVLLSVHRFIRQKLYHLRQSIRERQKPLIQRRRLS